MLKILVFVIFSVIATGEGSPRIIGGVDYDIRQAPYQVAIYVDKKHFYCGGSIYNSDIIITAAHCVENYDGYGKYIGDLEPSRLTICAGSSVKGDCQQSTEIDGYKKHEYWNIPKFANDVAVIRLNKHLQFNQKVQKIPLASYSPGAGANALVTGYGVTNKILQTSPSQLQGINVIVMDPQECETEADYFLNSELPENVICAFNEGKHICSGDSGGPLVVGKKLAGIVSYSRRDCNHSAGFFADVSQYRDWILNAIAEIRRY